MNKKLLDFKNKKKAKNPKFTRQDAYKKKRITLAWRKPRGWDSKQRKRMQRQAIVEPGYGSPKELRGVHKSGFNIVKVSNLKDIEKINPKEDAVLIANIGLKKKFIILEELIKKNI
ncbi:MAG: eL32 family ribosomal protein, partial [Candidatus Woesearchaeota archaeon]